MAEITIRPAEEEDGAAIIAFDHMASSTEEGRHFIIQAIADQACFVAVPGGEVVGYSVMTYHFFGCGFIELLFVPLKQRRQGIGEALVSFMENVCRTPKLFTSTNLSNLRMQALLNKRGYVLSGVIHNLDEDDPEIVYFKRVH